MHREVDESTGSSNFLCLSITYPFVVKLVLLFSGLTNHIIMITLNGSKTKALVFSILVQKSHPAEQMSTERKKDLDLVVLESTFENPLVSRIKTKFS